MLNIDGKCERSKVCVCVQYVKSQISLLIGLLPCSPITNARSDMTICERPTHTRNRYPHTYVHIETTNGEALITESELHHSHVQGG